MSTYLNGSQYTTTAANMCMYWIMIDTESNAKFKEEAEYCQEYGMRGLLCMDSKRYNYTSHDRTLEASRGSLFLHVGNDKKHVSRNLMAEYEVMVEYSVIKPYHEQYPDSRPRELYDAYRIMILGTGTVPLGIENETTISRAKTVLSSAKTTKTSNTQSRSGRRSKQSIPVSTVHPCDSASQISSSTMTRVKELTENKGEHSNPSIVNWAKSASAVSTSTIKAPSQTTIPIRKQTAPTTLSRSMTSSSTKDRVKRLTGSENTNANLALVRY